MDRDHQESDLARQEIEAARMLTDTTGGIVEFQTLQMKNWPYVVFDNIDVSEARVDVGKAEAVLQTSGNLSRKNRKITVIYDIKIVGRRPRKFREKWLKSSEFLRTWTKELFWPNTDVTVFVNGETYEQKRKIPEKKD